MNILFVDLEREWRGGQSQGLLTLRGLRDAGHVVQLLAAKDSPLVVRAVAADLAVRTAPKLGRRGWAAGAIAALAERKRFDLAHLNEPHALTAAWLARAHRQFPLLLSRRIGFPLRKGWLSRARYRAVERFLANSRDVARSLVDGGIAAEKISIVNEGVEVPNPVSQDERRAARASWRVAENEFLFGCASAFTPEKGQRHLVEALAIVRRKLPAVKLLLVGHGKCLAAVRRQAQELGLANAVLLPGFVADMDRFYAALDAFAFPSEFEGLGTALQAAMAHSLPCISTSRGALGEVVKNDRTALVVEPSGEAFAQAMSRLIADKLLRETLGGAGREEIERRFSSERMVAATIAVYEDVLRRRAI